MPHRSSAEDDDPIIASYPVYLTRPQNPSSSPSEDPSPTTAPKLFLLQYPAFRPADAPYNARNLQKPTSLRLKPATGFLELDIPVDTRNNYNTDKGSHYAKVLRDSRIAKGGGTHGLSGGFHTSSLGRNFREEEDVKLSNIPSQSDDPPLCVQTLGGKIVKPSSGDPIYMLGSFQNNTLHLSHLDGVVQVRPELHHLDAADELERSHARARGKDGIINANDDMAAVALPSTKSESKAIDIKLKPSSGPRDHDPGANTNTGLLRAIQQEPWQSYDWIDEDDRESHHMSTTALRLPLPQDNPETTSSTAIPHLESAISNSTYLDLLSAPRIERGKKGDKGLMSKVRGRERERQRRKRNEAARKERAATAKAAENREPRIEGEEREGEVDDEDEGEEENNGTAGEEMAGDGGIGGPSDEESSEDDEQQHQHHRREPLLNADGDEDDIQMLDTRPVRRQQQQQVDGAGEEDDEVQEIEKPETLAPALAPPKRGRGRPRKVAAAAEPIVVGD